MIRQDYHVHSMLSPDSTSALDDICRRGIELGLEEIVLTDHYEMVEGSTLRQSYRSHYLAFAKQNIMECRERWKGKIRLGFGIELGQWHFQPQASEKVVQTNPYDYVLASFHRVEHMCLSLYEYNKIDRNRLREAYLDGLQQMAVTADYDCLAHLDLIKRYAALQGCTLRLEDREELVRSILRIVIQRGKGLEVNTSGIGSVLHEPLPSKQILAWYRELGGEIVTVGSDAHTLEQIGAGYTQAEQLIKELGFRYLARYHERKASFVKV